MAILEGSTSNSVLDPTLDDFAIQILQPSAIRKNRRAQSGYLADQERKEFLEVVSSLRGKTCMRLGW
jgi:hypothetical protein